MQTQEHQVSHSRSRGESLKQQLRHYHQARSGGPRSLSYILAGLMGSNHNNLKSFSSQLLSVATHDYEIRLFFSLRVLQFFCKVVGSV